MSALGKERKRQIQGTTSVLISWSFYNKILSGKCLNKYLFLTVLEARMSKIKVLAGSVSGEEPLSDADNCFLSVSSVAETVGGGEDWGREQELWCLFLFLKGTNPIMGPSPSWPHLNWIISQKPHHLISSHWKLGLSHMNRSTHGWGEDTFGSTVLRDILGGWW